MADAAQMAKYPSAFIGCNTTITNYNLCTLDTCCLAQSSFLYRPSYGANLFFTIFFAAMLLPHVGLGIYYRTWGFMVGMVCGLILEVLGYIARVMMHNNPFDGNAFLLYLIVLTIAPVFISAAIYLCLTRIIAIYGSRASRFSPRTVAITFMTSDFLSLVLQALGGAIADTAAHGSPARQTGIDIMIAGLVLQVVSLVVYLAVCADLAFRCVSRKSSLDASPAKMSVRNRLVFRLFLLSLLIATLAILARSIFRAAELWGGFSGDLWNDETDFLILDGAMVGLAVLMLSVFHPGLAFEGQWAVANWSLRKKKGARQQDVVATGPPREMKRAWESQDSELSGRGGRWR